MSIVLVLDEVLLTFAAVLEVVETTAVMVAGNCFCGCAIHFQYINLILDWMIFC